MDDLDHLILRALKRNARTPVATIAGHLGVSRNTVQSRIERMERDKVIEGYTVVTAPNHGEQTIRATVLFSLQPNALSQVLSKLAKIAEVDTAHTTSGRFDLCAFITAKNTAQLDTILDEIGAIEGVKGTESLIHLSTRLNRTF